MQKSLLVTGVATVSFIGVLLVNAVAVLKPLNGLSTKQVSDLYPNLFTPAGITFSIWSVIYLLLAAFVVYSWRRKDNRVVQAILPWFILSCVLNASWITAWHFLFPIVSVMVMIALLATLTNIFLIIHADTSIDRMKTFFVVIPFSLYLAWICVATIANIAALLVHWNVEGNTTTQEIWTILMMTVASLLAALFLSRFRAWSFPLVVLWALLGICLRWQSGEHPSIVISGIVLMIGVTLFAIFWTLKWRRSTT